MQMPGRQLTEFLVERRTCDSGNVLSMEATGGGGAVFPEFSITEST